MYLRTLYGSTEKHHSSKCLQVPATSQFMLWSQKAPFCARGWCWKSSPLSHALLLHVLLRLKDLGWNYRMTNLQAWQRLCVEESTFKRIRKHQNAGSFGSWPALSFGRSGRTEAGGWSVGYPPSITRGTCPSFATFSDWTALQQVARGLSWSDIASRSVLSSQSLRLSFRFWILWWTKYRALLRFASLNLTQKNTARTRISIPRPTSIGSMGSLAWWRVQGVIFWALAKLKVEVSPSVSCDAEAVMKRLATAKVGTRSARGCEGELTRLLRWFVVQAVLLANAWAAGLSANGPLQRPSMGGVKTIFRLWTYISMVSFSFFLKPTQKVFFNKFSGSIGLD